MMNDRDIRILENIDAYYVLNRKQIQSLCFPDDRHGRVTRRRLQFLVNAKLLNRANVQTYHVGEHVPSTVYYPSSLGCEFLSSRHKDPAYLLTPVRAPTEHHVQHWLAVSETHICFDAAIRLQKEIHIDGWTNEWDVANQEEGDPAKHYRLYTLLRTTPKLVCAPDAAFLLSLRGHKKVHYLEEDRGTSGSEQVASHKCQGYAAMAADGLHKRRHFSNATVETFAVLMIAPNASRRNLLRNAMRGKPGAELWLFVSADEMQPARLFTAPIFYPATGDPRPLVRQLEDS